MNKKNKLSTLLAVLISIAATSCSEPDAPGGNSRISRIDFGGDDALIMLDGAQSRATDGDLSKAGLFKLDSDGNLSAVGFFVNKDGKESRSKLTVSPQEVYNLTENYIAFQSCEYYDEDGDIANTPDEYRNLIVRRSDGLVFSVYNTPLENNLSPVAASFLEDGKNGFYTSIYTFSPSNPGFVGHTTLTDGYGVWEQLSTNNSPIVYGDYPKLFEMNGGVLATTIFAKQVNLLWEETQRNELPGMITVGIIYPNGGYDTFGSLNSQEQCYVILNNALLQINTWLGEAKYISIGTSYGESITVPIVLNNIFGEIGNRTLSSWIEMPDKVLIKFLSFGGNDSSIYMVYDKLQKKFTKFDTGFSGEDDIELWTKNSSDGKFYGMIRENGKVTKVCWIDATTLTSGESAISIANEVDITRYQCDYSKATAQLTGTRRSDGWNVAISLNMKTGNYDVVYSNPNRPIIALIPLN